MDFKGKIGNFTAMAAALHTSFPVKARRTSNVAKWESSHIAAEEMCSFWASSLVFLESLQRELPCNTVPLQGNTSIFSHRNMHTHSECYSPSNKVAAPPTGHYLKGE